ncbi:PEP-CTERM sorting domain-containing protein [Emcibacter nanhaiensis]|uniref:PEP-CTERM sorting domain-containing protein n=1 Tax=Emcibacter nanhaiensis TaxID=1505037 RepID=A0A501PBD4_9PROT|nr:PEP-CTERM sorting domain-containing protein [Emcibacter nanhaiensis]TPD57545.1 PEP-CTERM sorting domain-containing protein [Emcibacter nanhaiensis]
MLRKYAAVAALAIALTPAAALAVPTYSIQVLEGMEGYDTRTTAINDSGQVVGAMVSQEASNLPVRSILWNDGNLVDLAGSDYFIHVAVDINNSGQIIGGYYDSEGDPYIKSYFWNGSLNNITLPEVPTPSWLPYGVNNHGQVVLAPNGVFANKIHLWSQADGLTPIDMPEGTPDVYPTSINDAGQIVGWFENQDGDLQAFFRDTDGSFHELPITGLRYYLGTVEINENGLVSGTVAEDYIDNEFITTGFNWSLEDGLTILDKGSFESSSAHRSNNDQVVGMIGNSEENTFGTIWDNEELFLLDNLVSLEDPLFGLLSITRASGVNNLGQIAAEGILLETGEQIGLLLTPNGIYIAPVPAPGALGLLICGAGLLIYRRRKQI